MLSLHTPNTIIPTFRTDRKAQEKLPFLAGKPRKSMENGSVTPGRKIAELSGDSGCFPPGKSENFPDRNTAPMKLLEFLGTGRFRSVLSDLGSLRSYIAVN
jgi:hypothetical protein